MKNLLLLLLIFAISTAYSEENYEDALKSNFVNNSGRDFWFTVPPAYMGGSMYNYVKIFVFSENDSKVTVSVPGLGYEEIKVIPKNNVGVFRLSTDTAQVKEYDYNDGPIEAILHEKRGINVRSTNPITVYCVLVYTFTTDGFLCLPTNTMGKSYIASPYSSRPIGSPDKSLPNMVGVTATQDNTKLKFTLGGNLKTQVPLGDTNYLQTGETVSYKMDRGDVVLFSNSSGDQTLTGSLIEADKNISVVSSHYCADIPVNNHWCDYLSEMDLPIHTWGKLFHIPMIKNKKYPGIIRIMAKEDSTTVYRDGVEIGFIKTGMGGLENDAWFETRVLPYKPNNTGVALYSSDKPIYVMFYNQGTQEDGNGYDPIEPFSMVISPVEQYQNEINLSAPISNEKWKTFEINYLNLIYPIQKDSTDSKDSIDIQVGVWEDGKFNYSPLNISTTFSEYVIPNNEGINFPNEIGNLQYVHAVIEMRQGVQKIKSNKPIMAYLYGGNPYDIYGYPASLGLLDLSLNDTISPVIEIGVIDCFGKVEAGIAYDSPNDSVEMYLHDIRLVPEESYNYGTIKMANLVDNYQNFIPGNTSSITWTMDVIDINEKAQGVVMCIDKAGNYTKDTILYYPLKYTMKYNDTENSSYFSLGNYKKNKTISKIFKIVNNSEYRELVIDSVSLLNENIFKIVKKAKSPISPLDSAYFEVEFISSEKGVFENTVSINFSCNMKYKFGLKAKVLASLITANDYHFEDKFDIADENAKPLKKKIVLSASCDNEFGSNLIVTGIDDSQLPPEFNHNIVSSFTLETDTIETRTKEFEIEFMPTTVGKFEGQIKFIAQNGGCDSICYVSGESFSSKSIEETASINIHPNPVKDELNISFIDNSNKNYDIQLIEMTGNILYSFITRTNQTINMNKYSAGLYYVLIKDKHGKLLRKEKIIKQ